jgi:hypothetical protein
MDLHPSIQELLSEIEAFRERTGMAVTAFGLAAFNDPWFIRDIKAGRIPSLRTIDRAREFMRSHDAESAA